VETLRAEPVAPLSTLRASLDALRASLHSRSGKPVELRPSGLLGELYHAAARGKTKDEPERVGKYMIKLLLSLERLSFQGREGRLCYQYGKDNPRQEKMDYLEFIARII